MVGAGLSFNTQPGTRGEFGFKQCGSSIANYSDIEMPTKPFQAFDGGPFLQENHLVHPPPSGPPGTHPHQLTFRSRDVRGVPVPVFVPEQRAHRINGFFQDSSRGVTQTAPPSQPVAAQENPPPSTTFNSMRNVFRNSQSKRPSVSKFPAHRDQPNKFNFSLLGSDDEHAYELQPIPMDNQQRPNNGKRVTPGLVPFLYQPHLTYRIGSVASTQNQYRPCPQEYSSSPPIQIRQAHLGNRHRENTAESIQYSDQSLRNHSFSFDLIPLDQARRKQAERRASGQDDPIYKSGIRDQGHAVTRNVSFATAGSHAGSQLLETPDAVATPTQGKVSRFVPRGFAQFSSPLAGFEDNTNGKTL